MKLYTERQMKEMFRMGLAHSINENGALAQFAPIELPSDEEIWDRADEIFGRADSEQSDVRHLAFMESAKWMRNKIQGGKK